MSRSLIILIIAVHSPSLDEPSDEKNAILPGTVRPHVSYTDFALVPKKSFDVITPTKTRVRCEFDGVSSVVKLIMSNGAEKVEMKNF